MNWQTIFSGLAVVVATLALVLNQKQSVKQRALVERQHELDRAQKVLAEEQNSILSRQHEWEKENADAQRAFEARLEEERRRERDADREREIARRIPHVEVKITIGNKPPHLPGITSIVSAVAINRGEIPVFCDQGPGLRVVGEKRRLDLPYEVKLWDSDVIFPYELVPGDSITLDYNPNEMNKVLLASDPNRSVIQVESFIEIRSGEEFTSADSLRVVTSDVWG